MMAYDYSKFVDRLRTFNDRGWPPEIPVFIKALAEAGFAYTGSGDLVFCFQCGVTVKDWQEGQEALPYHEYLNKDCPFLKKRSSNISGETINPVEYQGIDSFTYDWINGNIIKKQGESTQNLNDEIDETPVTVSNTLNQCPSKARHEVEYNYSKFIDRLRTFNDRRWPPEIPVFIKALVEAGFSYTGVDDIVFCFQCGVTAANWQEDEDPLTRHENLNKDCTFLKKRSLVLSGEAVTTEGGDEDIGKFDWIDGQIVKSNAWSNNCLSKQNDTCPPRPRLANERMRYESKRLESFAWCPVNKNWPSVEQLAKGGFYWLQQKEAMYCYCCNIEIDYWDCPEQNVILRHRSLSNLCSFANDLPSENVKIGDDSEIYDAMVALKISETDGSLSRNVYSPPLPSQPDQNLPPERLTLSQMFANGNRHLSEPYGYKYDQIHSEGYPEYRLHEEVDGMNCSYVGQYNRSSSYPPVSNVAVMNRSLSQYQSENIAVHKCIAIDLSNRGNRLNTFLTWPKHAPVQPVELAEAGFYYTSRDDCVKCYKCNVMLGKWCKGDTAWAEHIRYSSKCPLVLERLNEGNMQRQNHQPNMQSQTETFNKNHCNPVISANVNHGYTHSSFNYDRSQGSYGHVNQDIQSISSYPYWSERSYYMENFNPGNTKLLNNHPYANDDTKLECFEGNPYPPIAFKPQITTQSEAFQNLDENSNTNHSGVLHHIGNKDERKSYTSSYQYEGKYDYLDESGTTEIGNIPYKMKETSKTDVSEDDTKYCKICMDSAVEVTFVPCGHLVACVSCAKGLTICPVCRREVTQFLRTYFYGN